MWNVPIDPKKCCGMHSKEKEDNGECWQTIENEEEEVYKENDEDIDFLERYDQLMRFLNP